MTRRRKNLAIFLIVDFEMVTITNGFDMIYSRLEWGPEAACDAFTRADTGSVKGTRRIARGL